GTPEASSASGPSSPSAESESESPATVASSESHPRRWPPSSQDPAPRQNTHTASAIGETASASATCRTREPLPSRQAWSRLTSPTPASVALAVPRSQSRQKPTKESSHH